MVLHVALDHEKNNFNNPIYFTKGYSMIHLFNIRKKILKNLILNIPTQCEVQLDLYYLNGEESTSFNYDVLETNYRISIELSALSKMSTISKIDIRYFSPYLIESVFEGEVNIESNARRFKVRKDK